MLNRLINKKQVIKVPISLVYKRLSLSQIVYILAKWKETYIMLYYLKYTSMTLLNL